MAEEKLTPPTITFTDEEGKVLMPHYDDLFAKEAAKLVKYDIMQKLRTLGNQN
jgi:hypothetical protein